MWATLAIASALSLAPAQGEKQGEKLEIKHDRVSYGILGQERKDTKILPGDVFVVNYDIMGLRVNEDGQVHYSMGMELLNNKTGKPEFSQDPKEQFANNALGGSRLPAFAMSDIGIDQAPGEYTLKVTITDLGDKAKPTTTLARKFEVLPKKFGFTRVGLTTIPIGTRDTLLPVPPLFVPGQNFLVNFALTGFEIDPKTSQPDLAVEMVIRDEAGKATLAKPFTGGTNKNVDVPKEFSRILPMQFVVAINRTGKYTIELKATDKMGNTKAEQTLNFTVQENP